MEARTNSSIPAWWSPSNPTFDQPQVNLAAPLKQRFGVRAILQTSSEFLTSTCRGDVLPRFSSNLELEATRCPKGQRLRSKAPFGHWKTQTFIAGLRCFGLTAPFVVDRPMNRRIFETYVETQLAPTLSAGDVVILDNLAAHKSPKAEAAIRARGAWMLFLPPYSPDLNPIEMAFAKLKAHLRARAIRTIDSLWQAIGDICELYSPKECLNYFKAAGYV